MDVNGKAMQILQSDKKTIFKVIMETILMGLYHIMMCPNIIGSA